MDANEANELMKGMLSKLFSTENPVIAGIMKRIKVLEMKMGKLDQQISVLISED